MTWKEFKEAVDKALEEQGKTEDIELEWIDTNFFPDQELTITIRDRSMTIS